MSIKLNIKNKDFIKLDDNIKKYFKDIFGNKDNSILYNDGENFYLFDESDDLPFLLYHGTSEYMIQYFCKNKVNGFGNNELLEIQNSKMIKLLLELGKICIKYGIETEHTFQINSIRDKSNYFNYNNFFITNDINRAKNYACNGIGELYTAIVDCYNAVIERGIEYEIKDKELQELIEEMKSIKKEDCKPVIVVFNNFNWSNIPCYEDDNQINKELLFRRCFYPHMRQDSFRYFGPVIPYDKAIIIPIEEIDTATTKLYDELYKEHKVCLYENLNDLLRKKFDSIINSHDITINNADINLLITMAITSNSKEEILKKLENSFSFFKLAALLKVGESLIDIFKITSM
ncbi:hypothetical protein [Clostridium saccharoperbutylacetonicum]